MLIEMLGSRYERERIAAADVLGKLEARAAASAVTRTMEDESRAVRVAAIVAAGKIRTPEAVDRLVEVVRAGHEKGERPQAVIALGLIGDERAVPAVIRALDDRRLRGWAIEALGRIAGSDAEAAIRHAQIPAWHRWDHLRRRQALTRIAQRTGVGSPLVSALAERVARAPPCPCSVQASSSAWPRGSAMPACGHRSRSRRRSPACTRRTRGCQARALATA